MPPPRHVHAQLDVQVENIMLPIQLVVRAQKLNIKIN